MADRYYGLNVGAYATSSVPAGVDGAVSEASSTTSRPIELRVTYDATGINKVEVLKAIELLEYYITKDNWPPV